jgi:hypothetical protein
MIAHKSIGLRTAQLVVLADNLLGEAASVDAAFPELSQRECGLENGKIIPISGATVLGRERVWKNAQPFKKESIDFSGAQTVQALLKRM